MTIYSNFVNNIQWLTKSKAFCKSRNTIRTYTEKQQKEVKMERPLVVKTQMSIF